MLMAMQITLRRRDPMPKNHVDEGKFFFSKTSVEIQKMAKKINEWHENGA